MRVWVINVLQLLVSSQLILLVQARALLQIGIDTSIKNVDNADLTILREHRHVSKRGQLMIIHGLPHPWQGVFKSISTIQPPLPISIFSNFFLQVSQQANRDTAPARPVQRFVLGALVLEFIPKNGNKVITKEFVEATAMWLMHAAQNGWAGFFEAWVMDRSDMDTVYVHVVNYWDALLH